MAFLEEDEVVESLKKNGMDMEGSPEEIAEWLLATPELIERPSDALVNLPSP